METLDAIFTRQSISAVKPDPVPRAIVEKLLTAAVQAPNHHRVRPWRFVVLTGPARDRLGEVLADALHQRQPEVSKEVLQVERGKPSRAPVLIAVGVDLPDAPKVVEIENVCAAAAAVENLLIAATDLGLAAMWRTGEAATNLSVKQFLGFTPDQHVIGFVYLGYPLTEYPRKARPGWDDRVVWME